MKSFKKILETVYRPKGGDEQAFLDKHVVDLQAHPVATEFQFKGAKTPKAKRKADYAEKEDEKVYEAAEVHTKRADKEPVIVRAVDPKTGASKAKTVMRRAGEIKIGEEVELEESITKMSDARLKFHATKNIPHGRYTRKEIESEHERRRKTGGVMYASVKPSMNEEADLDEEHSNWMVHVHKPVNKLKQGKAVMVKARNSAEAIRKGAIKHGDESARHGDFLRAEKIKEEVDLDEKVKNPYAVGMAAAMKSTGDTPPLKKSTIVKGHEIAKSIKNEAMDPVGKADADINNDGKVDGSDKYLHARRKAIGKALRKEEAIERAAEYLVNENIDVDDLSEEQINELLGSIVKGAAKLAYKGAKAAVVNRKGNFRFSTAGRADAAETQAKKLEKANKDRERLRKSQERIRKAQSMRQNESTLRLDVNKAYPGVAGEPRVRATESVTLDELSKKTLGSYVKKASSDMANNAYNLGARDPLKEPGSWSKAFKRKAGIEKATDKLTKEEVEELDELKKSTLGSYVNRAADDISHIQRDITSTGTQSPDYKNLSRMRRNRKAGIATAVKKLTKEEVELDESFKTGVMKLKDGSSVTLTREDADALNSLSKLLNSANQSKMQDQVASSKKEFNQILAFAKEAV